MRDPKTHFILIASFDAAKLQEAKNMQKQFAKLSYRLDAVIINRAFPLWMPPAQTSSAVHEQNDYSQVLKFYAEFRDYYSERYQLYDTFAAEIDSKVQIFRIPDYGQDVCGLEDLLSLSERLASAQNERAH